MANEQKVQRVVLTPALAAMMEALSGPYKPLAAEIGNALEGAKIAADDATGKRGSVFASFKKAISVAAEAKHTVAQMEEGLSLACAEAGVPSGTFRGYISTVKNLATDVAAEKLTIAEVNAISVADARKRYKPEPTEAEKALADARAKLAEATKEWSAEQILLLAEYAADLNKQADDSEAESQEQATDADAASERKVA